MSFLHENLAAIAVAIVASVLVWLFGGTRGDYLMPVVPWLVAIMLEVLLFFPQRHSGETTYEARDRVWRALKTDRFTKVACLFLALLAIPFVNNGLCPNCDAEAIAQGANPRPLVSFLPFCVNRIEHLNVYWWFLTAVVAALVVRHSLVRSGKRIVLEMIVWNAALVALFGFIETASGAPGPFWRTDGGTYWGNSYFFATFGYPNMAGDYFTLLFGISVALWRDHYVLLKDEDEECGQPRKPQKAHGMFWDRHYFMIPSIVLFFAALNSLSRAAIILSTVSASLYYVHAFMSFLMLRRRADRVRVAVIGVFAFCGVIFAASIFMPKSMQKEVDNIGTVAVLNRVSGKYSGELNRASALWQDYKLFGCGGWGYRHFSPKYMSDKERRGLYMSTGTINVHNDYMQFLCEHGVVGFGLLAVMVLMLLYPVMTEWKRLAKLARFMKGDVRLPCPRPLFALPAPAFCLLVACCCTAIHAFGDCPLRSPAILIVIFTTLAAIPGFLPKAEEK